MTGLTALIAGATGLVGGECLQRLLAEPRYQSVIAVTRRELAGRPTSPKLRQLVTDFADLDGQRSGLRADHVYCALGTTMRKAGSRTEFRRIDLEIPLQLARLARAAGASHFSVVSAVGADRRSRFFYSRIKGELEHALIDMAWPSLAIFRPSLIAGPRVESRPLERLSGGLLRYAPSAWRPVAAADIAGGMVTLALESPPGVAIVESRAIPGRVRALRGDSG